MMKNILLYIMAFSSLLVACDSESDLKPSGAERNWLVVEDSDVPVDHERYLIFKETSVIPCLPESGILITRNCKCSITPVERLLPGRLLIIK